jgi:hypothetical protein
MGINAIQVIMDNLNQLKEEYPALFHIRGFGIVNGRSEFEMVIAFPPQSGTLIRLNEIESPIREYERGQGNGNL